MNIYGGGGGGGSVFPSWPPQEPISASNFIVEDK